jgi:ABC-type Fe3+ transport system permease subunit
MVLCGLIAFPTALWMAFQPPRLRLLLVFIVTVPFWTNLLVRTYAWILLLRTGGVIEQVLAWLGLGGVRVDVLYTPWATLMDASPCAVIAARMASAPSMAALAPISDGDAQSRMFRMGWSDPLCVG